MNMTRPSRGVRLLALAALIASMVPAEAAPLGVYDGNGALLGTYLGSDGIWINFASSKGFIARVMIDSESNDTPNGTIDGILVEADTWNTSDCSGPALSAVAVAGRLVKIRTSTVQLGYIAPDADPIALPAGTVVSSYEWPGSQCVARTLSRTTTFLPASPNDPKVTGIGDGMIALPIRVTFVDAVFESGFDRLT